MSATCGGVRVMSVYVPNGRALDHEHYQYKLRWLERLVGHLDAVADPTRRSRCAATSTSPPTTSTSGTSPSWSAPPT